MQQHKIFNYKNFHFTVFFSKYEEKVWTYKTPHYVFVFDNNLARFRSLVILFVLNKQIVVRANFLFILKNILSIKNNWSCQKLII